MANKNNDNHIKTLELMSEKKLSIAIFTVLFLILFYSIIIISKNLDTNTSLKGFALVPNFELIWGSLKDTIFYFLKHNYKILLIFTSLFFAICLLISIFILIIFQEKYNYERNFAFCFIQTLKLFLYHLVIFILGVTFYFSLITILLLIMNLINGPAEKFFEICFYEGFGGLGLFGWIMGIPLYIVYAIFLLGLASLIVMGTIVFIVILLLTLFSHDFYLRIELLINNNDMGYCIKNLGNGIFKGLGGSFLPFIINVVAFLSAIIFNYFVPDFSPLFNAIMLIILGLINLYFYIKFIIGYKSSTSL